MPRGRPRKNNFVEEAMAAVNKTMYEASVAVSREMRADLVDKLSTQGSRRRRSRVGEYPYRQSGNLIRKIRVTVKQNEDKPDSSTITIRSTAKYSAWLHAKRPFMDLFFAEWATKFTDRMNHHLGGKVSST